MNTHTLIGSREQHDESKRNQPPLDSPADSTQNKYGGTNGKKSSEKIT